jgi:hypothetical protein
MGKFEGLVEVFDGLLCALPMDSVVKSVRNRMVFSIALPEFDLSFEEPQPKKISEVYQAGGRTDCET